MSHPQTREGDVSRRSQGLSVYDTIKRDIVFACLPPGEKLRVHALRDRYRCGASPIREALNQLASEGWVERIDRRGFYVSGVSEDAFADLYFNRCFLEAEALRRSIERGGAVLEDAIKTAHRQMTEAGTGLPSATGEIDLRWEAAHKRFHLALLSACESPLLLSQCEKLYELNLRYRSLAKQKASHARRDVASEHAEIVRLTLRREAEDAVNALVSHYRRTGEYLFEHAIQNDGKRRPTRAGRLRLIEP
jgi:GntR family transcriptional regulator, carbon starvation induced regulator